MAVTSVLELDCYRIWLGKTPIDVLTVEQPLASEVESVAETGPPGCSREGHPLRLGDMVAQGRNINSMVM